MKQLDFIASMLCEDDPIRAREIDERSTPTEIAQGFLYRKARDLYVGFC